MEVILESVQKKDRTNKILRFFIYILSRLLIVAICVGLILLAFFTAMSTMNASVILEDGLSERASYMFSPEDSDNEAIFSRLFTSNFLNENSAEMAEKYAAFDITDFNQKVSSQFRIVYPWDTKVTFHVTEIVEDIVGEPKDTESTESVPAWENGEYDVVMVKENGQWKIDQIEKTKDIVLEEEASEEPSAVASPSESPVVSEPQEERTEADEVLPAHLEEDSPTVQ